MTIWTERTQILGTIESKANEVRLSAFFVFVALCIPLLLGWLAAKIVLLAMIIVKGLKYLIAAMKVGYQEGMTNRGR